MGLDPIAGYITRWGLKWDLAQYKEEMAKFDREQVFQVDDLQALSEDFGVENSATWITAKHVDEYPSNLRVTRSEKIRACGCGVMATTTNPMRTPKMVCVYHQMEKS